MCWERAFWPSTLGECVCPRWNSKVWLLLMRATRAFAKPIEYPPTRTPVRELASSAKHEARRQRRAALLRQCLYCRLETDVLTWCQWGAHPDFCSQISGCYVLCQKVHIEVRRARTDRGICLHHSAADELAAEDDDVDDTLRGKRDRQRVYRTLLAPALGVGFGNRFRLGLLGSTVIGPLPEDDLDVFTRVDIALDLGTPGCGEDNTADLLACGSTSQSNGLPKAACGELTSVFATMSKFVMHIPRALDVLALLCLDLLRHLRPFLLFCCLATRRIRFGGKAPARMAQEKHQREEWARAPVRQD